MNLKSFLKTLKLNESNLSMFLGALVILVVGYLVINYFQGLNGGSTITPIGTEETEISLPTIHTVLKGEDLWKISEKYYKTGYNWLDIATENKIPSPYIISEGQTLNIPDVEPKLLAEDINQKPTVTVVVSEQSAEEKIISQEQVGTTIEKTDTEKTIVGPTYKVVKGDNLWNIAVRAYGDGYRWVDIAKTNKLVNPGMIHAGNIFVLPR